MTRRASTGARWPDAEERCVWMVAGVINYKLCDRGFDCEHCPLDQALRNGTREPACRGGVVFRDDRRYHRAHTWLLPLEGDRARLGIDCWVAGLIGRIGAVVMSPVGTQVVGGRAGCWLVADGEAMPVQIPASGSVVEVNAVARNHPFIVAQSPYDDGWLLEIENPGLASAIEALGDADDAREWARRDAETVRAALPSAEIGATALDGGVLTSPSAETVRQELGLLGWRALLQQMLAQRG